MAPDMKTVRFPRGVRVLHIEAPGCIVNIRPGLTDANGRPVCAIEILPDAAWSVADGAHSNVRVTQDTASGRFAVDPRFGSWAEVLGYARAHATLYYCAPLDARASRVVYAASVAEARASVARGIAAYVVQRTSRIIRIFPLGCVGRGRRRTSDPFTADASHLDRFNKEA